MFVTNRVQIIRSNTDTKQWQHIDTNNNPADHTWRGSSAEELMRSNWFSGPAFLWEKEIPTTKERFPIFELETQKLRQLYTRMRLKNLST